MDDKTLHIQTDFIQQDGKIPFITTATNLLPMMYWTTFFPFLLLSRTAVWSTTAADRAD